MLLLKISWRNIWRHKWRSALTIGAVCFGISLTVWGYCLTEGSHEQIVRSSVEAFSGHLQIHSRGYQEDQNLRRSFVPDSALFRLLESRRPLVSHWSARVNTFALVSVGETSYAALVVGIDPRAEAQFIHWDRKLDRGEYLRPEDPDGALVGAYLAENLGVAVGDTIILVAQGFYGALSGGLKVVRGIFLSHSTELDQGAVLINLAAAQDLLDMGRRVNTLVVMVSSNDQVAPLTSALSAQLKGRGLEVIPWQEILPDLVQFVELDSVFGVLTQMILILVIGFMVLNTFLMSVMERVREFGVMRSLGASPSQVVVTIVLEAVLLSALGLALGNLVGVTASWFNSVHPLDFSSMGEEVYKFYGMDPRIYAHLNWTSVLAPNLIVTAVIGLALAYPAFRAAHIKPAEAVARR